ncbi:MAG: DNA-processing protein DprA [Oscillospiraceae bacterium]|jgi:DNA processing protein|nr:DNA-processing protein DprA [Oscillospiraceae bacterium]
MNDNIYWVWLSRLSGIKPNALMRYIERFASAKRIYDSDETELRQVVNSTLAEITALTRKDLSEAQTISEKCQKLGVRIIPLSDEKYPERLMNIYDPPIVLYVKGNIPDIDKECTIGIVGTRKASQYGLTTAERLGYEVAECGGLIISGLAEGIDSAAARGALKASGRAVGVLGTGIDIVFPSQNERLFGDVESGGCLISEYPPGERATRYTFPARNRIISGLSLGVCVVEAPERSGSLITASRALEQGRDVFAVPGSIDLQSFKGSNSLLRDGAELVTCGWDIVSRHEWRFPGKIHEKKTLRKILSPERSRSASDNAPVTASDNVRVAASDAPATAMPAPVKKRPEGLSENELKVLDAIIGQSTADMITSKTDLRPEHVMVALTLLELKGLVKNRGNMTYETN